VKILLDTAPFWWIAIGSNKLSARARDVFSDPSNEIALSPVSIWELLVKHQLGKLPAQQPLTDLIAKARNERVIRALPLIDSAVLHLPTLPMIHRDPFDRLLICQALDEQMTLLTSDQEIRDYNVPTIW
jgi:PIN domain nuclease of toxin-antitoxin system